jgi:hypothetical protein
MDDYVNQLLYVVELALPGDASNAWAPVMARRVARPFKFVAETWSLPCAD